ncbi:MAG: 50S ribosomal protein L11 methyltransferase [Clostridia bacterium]|nr:50S ribosomal protein L11 methyltransferase [Clostridia bacterium]MBQ3077786.1 50S ribosomal protein L11 methyltransferase [Clostridia bacterium]
MDFWQLTIETTSEGIPLLSDLLERLGVTGFVVNDPADFEEFLEGTQTYWDYVDESLMDLREQTPSLTFYLACNEQGEGQIRAVEEALAQLSAREGDRLGRLSLAKSVVREEDWANNWKQYFRPFPVGEKLYIKPSWEELTAEAEGRTVLEIDPASSFGTGSHHTTQLCLKELETLPLAGTRVLDMGCGSGILGIAAALLGAGQVTAVDIDQNAVFTTGENVEKNNIDPAAFTLLCGDVNRQPTLAEKIGDGYDVVLANIVADVILAMRQRLHDFLRPGGTLIASGIIGERAAEVREGLVATGLILERESVQEDWVALRLRRPA